MGNNQEDSKLLKQSILFMKTGKPQFSLKNTFEFISLLTKWKEEKIFPLIDVFFLIFLNIFIFYIFFFFHFFLFFQCFRILVTKEIYTENFESACDSILDSCLSIINKEKEQENLNLNKKRDTNRFLILQVFCNFNFFLSSYSSRKSISSSILKKLSLFVDSSISQTNKETIKDISPLINSLMK